MAEFTLSGTEEVKRRLLSFGSRVQVLEPAELREDIVQECEAILRQYQPPLLAEEFFP